MARQNKKRVSQNYLDFIPVRNNRFESQVDEQGNVTIFVENKGVFHFLAQKLLKKPRISQIHLDEMGNYIWPLMDGTHSVYEIALLVKERFGEKAEPLYDRLVQYIKTMESYDFVKMT